MRRGMITVVSFAMFCGVAAIGQAAGTLAPRDASYQPIRIRAHHVAVYTLPLPPRASLSEVTIYAGDADRKNKLRHFHSAAATARLWPASASGRCLRAALAVSPARRGAQAAATGGEHEEAPGVFAGVALRKGRRYNAFELPIRG
jgi:hypothetical protein